MERNLRILREDVRSLSEDSGRRYWIDTHMTANGRRYSVRTQVNGHAAQMTIGRFSDVHRWIWGGLLILERYREDKAT